MMSGCYGVGGGTNATITTNILQLLNAAAGILFSNNPISVRLTITMTNGSQVVFEWIPPAARPILTFAVDANHNPIPLNAQQLINPSPPYGYLFSCDDYHDD